VFVGLVGLKWDLMSVSHSALCSWLMIAISVVFFYANSGSVVELYISNIHITPSLAPLLLSDGHSPRDHGILATLQALAVVCWFWLRWTPPLSVSSSDDLAALCCYSMLIQVVFMGFHHWWLDSARVTAVKALCVERDRAQEVVHFLMVVCPFSTLLTRFR
jgi:hypothetical protein